MTSHEPMVEAAGVPRARAMVARAEWAARAFASYDASSVRRIVEATAAAAAAHAEEFAAAAVAETRFDVAAHKVVKNTGCSAGLVEHYRGRDYVSPRHDPDTGVVSVPRPAGVVLALTPSTNPVATTYFKTLLALMTRNAIIISPHPMARQVSASAVAVLAEAAVAAGAPDGCVQVVAEPSVPLVDALMADDRVDVVLATGGTAMVRAAYRSGNPALGVGPGNVPVLIDADVDPRRVARLVVESKSFDNSVLCTNESVLVVVEQVADRLRQALRQEHAHVTSPEETEALRRTLFDGHRLRPELIGRDAAAIAAAAGFRVPSGTLVLVTPVDLVVPEEPLVREKLMPVLALATVPSVPQGIRACQAVLRISGAGHSAAVHSESPATVMAFAAAVPVLRVGVNVGSSLGNSGFHTGLAPTMTIGTGFFGRSSLAANLAPEHLVQHTQVAYPVGVAAPAAALVEQPVWRPVTGPVPAYPVASNLHLDAPDVVAREGGVVDLSAEQLRDEVRRLIIEELRAMVKG